MTECDKRQLVRDYIDIAHEESRVIAAETYIHPNATIRLNGTEMTRQEYLSQIAESDRFFVPRETDIRRMVVQEDVVVILATSSLEQAEQVYGVQPTDELIEQSLSVFHRIVDDKIVELDIVVDNVSKLQQLGLLSEDPTRDQLKNQYYEVLTRVLRHDLRNRLNVIRLVADSLADDTVDDPTVAGLKTRAVVDDLLRTTDKARALEQLAIDTRAEPASFRLDTLIDPIVEKYNENTEACCTTIYPETGPPLVTTDKKLLWNAINELLENSVAYNESDDPTVTVETCAVDSSRYTCAIRIEDNGSGIPADVLRPILENRETKLLHGSGIGLWVVKWCVTRLDGDIEFEQPDTGGTTVRLLLPNLS